MHILHWCMNAAQDMSNNVIIEHLITINVCGRWLTWDDVDVAVLVLVDVDLSSVRCESDVRLQLLGQQQVRIKTCLSLSVSLSPPFSNTHIIFIFQSFIIICS